MSHGRRQHCSAYIKKTCITPSRRAQCTRGGNIQPVHARLDRGVRVMPSDTCSCSSVWTISRWSCDSGSQPKVFLPVERLHGGGVLQAEWLQMNSVGCSVILLQRLFTAASRGRSRALPLWTVEERLSCVPVFTSSWFRPDTKPKNEPIFSSTVGNSN